ncbi:MULTISPECIES: DUF5805 domain-containing protein [Salinibaculum]|uniref:DUF5805 domain-containing protein n=1 Tax=Salinibaculum TaxID=2732368 RepID=UPI0030D270A1
MAADSDRDTSRTVVKTYVPAYQREEWDDHADELDMSRSEFVKAMVQAGRRGFEGRTEPTPSDGDEDSVEDDTEPVQAATASIEESVLDALSADEYLSWDELLAAVSDDIESRLEDTLQVLQAADRVRYSGRHGGYTLEA